MQIKEKGTIKCPHESLLHHVLPEQFLGIDSESLWNSTTWIENHSWKTIFPYLGFWTWWLESDVWLTEPQVLSWVWLWRSSWEYKSFHTHEDRNVSSQEKGDQSEQLGIDLHWPFPLREHMTCTVWVKGSCFSVNHPHLKEVSVFVSLFSASAYTSFCVWENAFGQPLRLFFDRHLCAFCSFVKPCFSLLFSAWIFVFFQWLCLFDQTDFLSEFTAIISKFLSSCCLNLIF